MGSQPAYLLRWAEMGLQPVLQLVLVVFPHIALR